ncbi:DUF6264 family protein [Leucobacter luti]|uniref:Uncharacterized protein n=1 Tax=Leucobacter luti TaxID=340320 RepID=A0A4Q7U4E9_9MICO|nr:DUF6264 family protein [Leucobacter luti]MBL3700617.1 hypothetical protein [Leucobacter luti]RZT68544.1 hypothetical protein EV139_0269 [Leucobacter luti]
MPEQPTGSEQDRPASGAPAEPQHTADAPASPAAPQRPAQPAYGEYAPEGWSWQPEGTPDSAAPEAAPGSAASAGAAPQAAGQHEAAPGTQMAAPPAGVPHNLGAPARPDAAPQRAAGDPYRAAAAAPQAPAPQTPAAQDPGQPSQLPPAYRVPGPRGPRIGDRVITIMLLVLGAFGALNISSSFFGLESQIRFTGVMIGIEDPKLASWIGPLGVISGLVVLLLFAVTLIFSIQRMRANKLAFWVPLVAGVVAAIVLIVVPMIAMGGAPEIMQQLESDPTGSLDKMFEYIEQLQQP